MNTDVILRLLTNSGFHILGADGSFIYLEDPSCILRSFETFIEYAWIIIAFLTGLLLFGWAISMIRGAKNDIFTNLRNLLIIFGVLTAAGPIVNMIWGDDLFARGCRTIKVPISEVNRLLDARKLKLTERNQYDLYEEFDIYDSGAPYYDITAMPNEIPYADAPVMSAGNPGDIDVAVSPDTNVAINTTPNTTGPENTIRRTSNDENTTRDPRRTSATGRPNRASEMSKDVVYENADGTRHKRTGGSRAWRNSNPGNIRYSEFARKMGAIGQAGGFAVFPDEETGMRAISQLLRSDSYNRLTVAGAISRYAPPSENNTAAYHRQIEKLTGLSINKRMSDLTDAELARVAGAIRTIEGWTPGRIVAI